MNSPMRWRASPRSRNTAASMHSRHSVPQKRSIFPSVCGCRGEATTCRTPRFSSFLGKGALAAPGHVLTAIVGQHLLGRAVSIGLHLIPGFLIIGNFFLDIGRLTINFVTTPTLQRQVNQDPTQRSCSTTD